MNNCGNCKKKLKLLAFDCKCEQKFCINCFAPEKHKCQFNYYEYNKQLTINNMVVINKTHNYNKL